jgi:hypothetical protein
MRYLLVPKMMFCFDAQLKQKSVTSKLHNFLPVNKENYMKQEKKKKKKPHVTTFTLCGLM